MYIFKDTDQQQTLIFVRLLISMINPSASVHSETFN